MPFVVYYIRSHPRLNKIKFSNDFNLNEHIVSSNLLCIPQWRLQLIKIMELNAGQKMRYFDILLHITTNRIKWIIIVSMRMNWFLRLFLFNELKFALFIAVPNLYGNVYFVLAYQIWVIRPQFHKYEFILSTKEPTRSLRKVSNAD